MASRGLDSACAEGSSFSGLVRCPEEKARSLRQLYCHSLAGGGPSLLKPKSLREVAQKPTISSPAMLTVQEAWIFSKFSDFNSRLVSFKMGEFSQQLDLDFS